VNINHAFTFSQRKEKRKHTFITDLNPANTSLDRPVLPSPFVLFVFFFGKNRPVLRSLHQRACITCSRRAGKKNRLPAKATQWCNANSPIDPLLYEMLDANQVSVRSVCWSLFRTEKAGTVRFSALQNGGARHAAWSTSFIKKKKKSDFQHSITKLNDIDHPTVKIIWLFEWFWRWFVFFLKNKKI